MKPTAQQFEEWRNSPVSEWVFNTFLPAEMKRTREAYQNQAWEGWADKVAHAAHRERHDTLNWLRSLDMTTIDGIMEMIG